MMPEIVQAAQRIVDAYTCLQYGHTWVADGSPIPASFRCRRHCGTPVLHVTKEKTP